MKFTLATVAAAAALFAGQSNADLFNCNDNQNAFPPTPGYFVAHFTSIRDTSTGKPWVRICRPSSSGNWDQAGVLEIDCSAESTRFSTGQTGLDHDFTVIGGNGCNSDSSNLDGASMEYDGQVATLQGGGEMCGPRDHGISCEFVR